MDLPWRTPAFEVALTARWADMDFNQHMANTAFLAAAAQVRMEYFEEHGFRVADFARLDVGPVIRRDELEYFREVQLLDTLRCTLQRAGLSADGARFVLRNEFHTEDGVLAARVTSRGGWLSLSRRKLCVPPPALAEALQRLAAAEMHETLPDLRPA